MENLLFFYGRECPHCKRMEKMIDKIVADGHAVTKLEIWHDKENEDLMVKLDCEDEPCGGVPFFLNQKTKATLCGEVTLKEIKEWAGEK